MIKKIRKKDQHAFECIEMDQINKLTDKAIESNSENDNINVNKLSHYSSIDINKKSFIDDEKNVCNKIYETMNNQNNENLKNRDVNWFENNDIEEDKFNSINSEDDFRQMVIGMKRNEKNDKLLNLDKILENDSNQTLAPFNECIEHIEYDEDFHKKCANNFREHTVDLINDTHEKDEKNSGKNEQLDLKQTYTNCGKNEQNNLVIDNNNDNNKFYKVNSDPDIMDSSDIDLQNVLKKNKTRDIFQFKKKGEGGNILTQTCTSDFKDITNITIPFSNIKKENGKNYNQNGNDEKIADHPTRLSNQSANALQNNNLNKKENISQKLNYLKPESLTPNNETTNYMDEVIRKMTEIVDKKKMNSKNEMITEMDGDNKPESNKLQILDKHKIKRNDLKHSLKKYHSNNVMPRRQSSNDIYTFEHFSNKKFHSTNNIEDISDSMFDYSPEILNRKGIEISEKKEGEVKNGKDLVDDNIKNDIISETVAFEKNFKNLITDEHFSLTPANRNEENSLNLYGSISDMSTRNESKMKMNNRNEFFKDNTIRSFINQARESFGIKEGNKNTEINKEIIELIEHDKKKQNNNNEEIKNPIESSPVVEVNNHVERVHTTGVVDLYENNFKTISQRPLSIDQIKNMNNFQNLEKNNYEFIKNIENENKETEVISGPVNRLTSKGGNIIRNLLRVGNKTDKNIILNIHNKSSIEKKFMTNSTDINILQINNKTNNTSICKDEQVDATGETEKYTTSLVNDNKIKRRIIDCKNDKLKWGATQVIIDIDDTIRSSGGYKLFNYALGGVDAQYHRGETYPGSFQFIFELAMNKLPPECKPLLLSVLTARIPQVPITENSFLNIKFNEVAERRGIKNWGIDCDNKTLYSTLKEWVWNETRGEKKFINFKQLHKHVVHQNSLVRYIWIGDTGDMDKQAGEMMIKTFPQRMKAVFLHHVKGKDDETLLPNDYFIKSVPVFFFRTYIGAATKAYAYNLIDKKGLTRVLVQAVLDLEKSRTPSSSSKWEDLIKDILLSDAIDELDKYNAETVNKTKKIISYRMKEISERKLHSTS
ncbi:conserved Plasmodium protein, unknown function [Plasmodium berghei]|uniref:Uncharacterized protein n=2 Tax=Plasmodium berghei TaxID=5821 RepID=A0A509AKA1_PLABA|nr:conserved protein, unknown function [Plasmodium berghei ANKA]CXI60611.1 conserved Plasmodium protein, unknown function [Plasmodium berghei]SCM23577.1 conserved Plasmodium protein, unknown function [Plasmodium berghei]SCN26667.1 conserved Plasmodium protein, unknown function [Plasmodium berghei]SCO60939.1 conserved Plasmodium protein, unknown function [Plasmodium berghei]SCO62988.1 conserved Plasmodium protein, unknown function [Plasmodium berghei]|eukprot:XP_034422283.1 conserved protein, unknown function [Plasmodium berghei ANKA]